MSFYKYPLIFFCIIISACSSQQSRFTPAETASENQATIYIYRPASLSNIVISPIVLLDEQTLFTLAANRYDYIHLNAGNHEFKLALGDRYTGNKQLNMNIEAGRSYYLKVQTSLRFKKNAPYTRRFDLLHMNADTAQGEIRLTQQITSRQPTAEATRDETESNNNQQQPPQFDLSKNRNPFAK